MYLAMSYEPRPKYLEDLPHYHIPFPNTDEFGKYNPVPQSFFHLNNAESELFV